MADEAKQSITIDDVLAYGPCSPYDNADYLSTLFAGRPSLTLSDVLAIDIPDLHKIVCIVNTSLISDSQIASINAALLALITDPDAPEIATFNQNGSPYGYGAVTFYLARTSGGQPSDFYSQVETLVINMITAMVT